MARALLLSLFLVVVGGGALPAWARCPTPGEAGAAASAIAARIACAGSDADCGTPVPACGETGAREVAGLFGGGRCGRAIREAGAAFLPDKLAEYLAGARRSVAARAFDEATALCDAMEPAVAGTGFESCQGAGRSGRSVRRCVRSRLSAVAEALLPEPVRPNVVLVISDDQRFDTMEAMPGTLDRFADQGLSFSNAFVTTAICAPSRASIYTGRYAHHHGVLGNQLARPDGPPVGAAAFFDPATSFHSRLAAAGYRTGLFGIYLAGLADVAERPAGWDRWLAIVDFVPVEGHDFPDMVLDEDGARITHAGGRFDTITDRFRDEAVAFMRANADAPFFVQLAVQPPHAPAIVTERHADTAVPDPEWAPSVLEPDVAGKPSWIHFNRAVTKDRQVRLDRIRDFRASQLRTLRAVDDAVVAVDDAIEELGLADDTVLVFLSDNGHHWGEHWGGAKSTAYEEAIRVPLFLRHPRRFPAGAEVSHLALGLDLAATILDAAGVPSPPGNGLSLWEVADGTREPRRAFLIENYGALITAPSEAVRTERWKYIRTWAAGGEREELYDLATDPLERRNVAASPASAERLAEMRELLVRLRAE